MSRRTGAAGTGRTGLGGWLDTLREQAARITPGTLLVRGGAFAFTVGALLVACPAALLAAPGVAVPLVCGAALPALAPRSWLTTLVVGGAVAGWLAATTVYGEPVALPRLVTLACLLYLGHTTTALAAVLPYDTIVAPAVLLRWLVRAAVVLALTGGFALAATFGVRAVGGRAYLVAAVVGVLLVAALVGLLVLLRRPPAR
ncbi:hypothetical protein ACNTMW_09345 [Planosporangium sp. 12N6]|uniref:hypothetical protein n=1 Tax=Planosporangium spinosum TaxID=3402278 RepID=UPI003CED0F8F